MFYNVIKEGSISSLNKKVKNIGFYFAILLFGIGYTTSYASETYHNLMMNTSEDGASVQQSITITGTVTDTDSQPLPGVNVLIKGTSQGTVTDADGRFTISIPSSDAVLQFHFIGFIPQEFIVGDQRVINVTMEEDSLELEEVVVVGYGTTRKKDLTGAIGVVTSELISKRNTMQLAQTLQGSIPGVTVTRSSGAPSDGATSIRIRGVTTIGDSSPLVLIDGVPGNITDVHANDIDNLSVLKDGSSAAIYGARAAAGVILITTKRAKAGVQKLSYSYELGFDSPTKMPTYVNTPRWMSMVNELVWNDNNNVGSEYPRYAKELIDEYPKLHAEDPDRYPDTDWTSYFKSYALRQSHNLNFSAGYDKLRTLVTMTYDDYDALTDGRNYKRMSVRANNDVAFNKVIAVHFNIQYLNTDDERLQASPTLSTLKLEPYGTAFYSDGRIATFRNGECAWPQVLRGGSNSQLGNTIQGQIGINITPVDGLKFTGIFAPSYGFGKSKVHSLKLAMTSLDDPNLITGYVGNSTNTSLSESRSESKKYNAQLLANYSKSLRNHQFEILVGYETNYSFNENLGASRILYTLDTYPYLNIGPLENRDNSGSAEEYANQSYFGRLAYNYLGRYLIQGNIRRDGSSRFHPDHRWGTFPSVSLGWILSEERFFGKNHPVSFLKLRASYGELGNERILIGTEQRASLYPYQSTVSFGNALFHQGTNVVSEQTAYIGKYVIEDISWETTKSINFGIDAYFFNNRLNLTADYYIKTTSDMLLDLEIPDYIGQTNPSQNTGKMETKGWEIELKYRDKIGDVNYSVSANLSDFKSVMGDLGGTQFLGDQVKFKGSEFNEWYGYKSNGIYQSQEEIDNTAVTSIRVRPGDIRYIDVNGPDGVPDGIISSTFDRVLLGGSLPRFEYGGNISLAYKGFDFSVLLQGVGKTNSYLDINIVQPLVYGAQGATTFVADDYWSVYNTPEENLKARYPRLSEVGASSSNRANGNNYVTSDYWLINGRYFRVKNIILGHTMPSSITNRLKIDNLRLSCNLIDFFTLSKFPKGIDPELSTGSGYFIMKSVVFTLSLGI